MCIDSHVRRYQSSQSGEYTSKICMNIKETAAPNRINDDMDLFLQHKLIDVHNSTCMFVCVSSYLATWLDVMTRSV